MAINDNYLSTLPFYHLDDISFTMLIYEQSHGPRNLNNDRLDSLFFNPITQPKLNEYFLLILIQTQIFHSTLQMVNIW